MISVDLWKVSEELNKLEVHVIGGIAYVAVDDEMTENELFVEMRGCSFDEIFENVWMLYSTIGKIVDVLNE